MSYHSKTRFRIMQKHIRDLLYHLIRTRMGHGSNGFNALPRPSAPPTVAVSRIREG